MPPASDVVPKVDPARIGRLAFRGLYGFLVLYVVVRALVSVIPQVFADPGSVPSSDCRVALRSLTESLDQAERRASWDATYRALRVSCARHPAYRLLGRARGLRERPGFFSLPSHFHDLFGDEDLDAELASALRAERL